VRVGGLELPLFSGAIHYWRLDPDRWGAILDAAAGLGFRVVETYIPWSVHERAPHHFDFGRESRARDIGRFLELVHERGLYALVRPGPHINSELTDFGFPARVLADPKVQARTAHGTPAILPMFPRPFPTPSYASEAFLDEVAGWYDAILPLIASRLAPHGPVLAVQVDNEWSYFFRSGLYDLDYSDGAVAGYRRFLLDRYGDLEALNEAYGTKHTRIDSVHPPRRYVPSEPIRYHLDWARHQSWALLEALRRLEAMQRVHLPETVPLFTNLPPGTEAAPFDLSGTEQLLDQVGLDLYHTRRELSKVARAGRYLTAQTRLPSCPEFGAGCFLTYIPITPEDNAQTALAAMMYGVRSINFYMLVDRERWYGAPIRTTGALRQPLAGFYASLNRVIERYRLAARPRACEVAVLRVRLYDRLGSISSLLGPIPPLVLHGLGIPQVRHCREGEAGTAAAMHERWSTAWQAALHRAEIDFDLADSDQDEALLRRYRMIFVPVLARFDAALAARLVALARAGMWVVYGPEEPETDLETGAPIDWPGPETITAVDEHWQARAVGVGALIRVSAPDLPLEGITRAAGVARTWVRGEGAGLESIHGARLAPYGGDGGLVWIMNTGAVEHPARVAGAAGLLDVFSGERIDGRCNGDGQDQGQPGDDEGASTVVRMPAHTVRLFEILSGNQP
jgi:beta-galactosidase